MKWKLNLPKPSTLVYYYVKINGLAPFTLIKNRFYAPTLPSKLYSVWLAAIHISVTTIASIEIFERFNQLAVPVFEQFRAGIQLFINLPTTCLTLTILVFTYEKILSMMNKLCDIGNEMRTLGIQEDNEKFFKNILAIIVVTDPVIILISVILHFVDSEWPILYTIIYMIDVWQYLKMGLIFTQMLLFIRQRFKLINEDLYNAFRPADHHQSLDHLQMFDVCSNPLDEIRGEIKGLSDLERVQKIELLHLELCDLLDRTTNLFAIPILMNSLQILIELMLCSFEIYALFRDSNQLSSGTEIFLFLSSITAPVLRMTFPIVQLLVLAHASTTTCREGNATRAVLSKVWNEPNSQELEDEFSLFSLQLLHKPVAVSVLGFLGLDYSYLCQIFCAVVACLVIMIQFDISEPNTGT